MNGEDMSITLQSIGNFFYYSSYIYALNEHKLATLINNKNQHTKCEPDTKLTQPDTIFIP